MNYTKPVIEKISTFKSGTSGLVALVVIQAN